MKSTASDSSRDPVKKAAATDSHFSLKADIPPGKKSAEKLEKSAELNDRSTSSKPKKKTAKTKVSTAKKDLTKIQAATTKPSRKPSRKRAAKKKAATSSATTTESKKMGQPDLIRLEQTVEVTFQKELLAEKKEATPIGADLTPEVTDASGRPLHNVFMHTDVPEMYIVQISPEMAPVAKVGGLADVVFGLSHELAIRGHTVEVILPKYDNMRYDHIFGLCESFTDLWVPWYNGAVHCTVYFGFVYGRKCFFIEPHSNDNFFNRGIYYGAPDDVQRYAFFSRAAMEFLLKSGKRPDIIHCHDWHTGLVPVYQWEIYQHLGMHRSRVCYTIHNFGHQGICGADVLKASGLNRPDYYLDHQRLGDYKHAGALNLMKGGIVYSNFVTTVSPTHAGEVKDKGLGFGLEPALNAHHMKFGGVINGIDYVAWNPESDPLIPVHFSSDSIEKKYDNKHALRQRFFLAENDKPIVAYVGRLDPQKGLELVRHAIFYCVNNGAQFVLLGSSPEQSINAYFWHLKNEINENPDCHIEIGFNEELAHLIYAGSDMMLVPSRYEPCGLTQLISMRYGTVPVVRSVGGLADTVFDKDYSNKGLNERNGYVFHNDDYPGVENALARAISCYYEYPEHFRNLMLNGMAMDYSWNVPGQHYLNIFNHIRAK